MMKNNKSVLEICCYTFESVVIAEQSGAGRIELCDNYPEGGTTPSYATIKSAVESLTIPVNVIIRPRGGDFFYSESEFEIIKQDVLFAKEAGANGVVIGFLKADGSIDIEKTKDIVALASPMEVSYHRAFDMCKDPFKALKQLIDVGITRILSSGAQQTAVAGSGLLAELVLLAGNNLTIMPGSGVRSSNIAQLIEATGAREFHASAKTFVPSGMKYFNRNISFGGDSGDEYKKISVNPEEVSKMRNLLDDFYR